MLYVGRTNCQNVSQGVEREVEEVICDGTVPIEGGCGSTRPRIPLTLLVADNQEVVTPWARCKLRAYSRTDACCPADVFQAMM
jgi:hypothetical protein